MQTKWTAWYDSLPAHTKIYLKNQAIWHDSDMWKAGAVGAVFGIVFAFLFLGA